MAEKNSTTFIATQVSAFKHQFRVDIEPLGDRGRSVRVYVQSKLTIELELDFEQRQEFRKSLEDMIGMLSDKF